VHLQESELKRLGISDFIVINGGSNDIDKPSRNINVVLSKLIRFVTKYNNTNILMVTMLFRHDLAIQNKRLHSSLQF
jgi:lysophospholipase L1-like esterase